MKKKIEEIIGLFEGYHAECGGFVQIMNREKAIRSAIVHYELVVKRDEKIYFESGFHHRNDGSSVAKEHECAIKILSKLKSMLLK